MALGCQCFVSKTRLGSTKTGMGPVRSCCDLFFFQPFTFETRTALVGKTTLGSLAVFCEFWMIFPPTNQNDFVLVGLGESV